MDHSYPRGASTALFTDLYQLTMAQACVAEGMFEPAPEAQVVETWVMSQMHVQTVLATKAARVADSADGRPMLISDARRDHRDQVQADVDRAAGKH